MEKDIIAFHGSLQQLLEKVETGEMIPRLQASHAPMCKFFTAYYVISGIRHVVPLVHGPTGCPLYMSDFVRTRECCEIRGVPLEPTACTALDESHVIYGGEGKLLEAVKEAYAKYHPDLIVILSCCCSGIIGDDVESIAREAEKLVGCRVLALRSEGFGGDFRSGYEDAFRLIMELMEPPKEKRKGTVNILGARWGPTTTEFEMDMDEIERLLGEVGIRINAIIAGGCTVEELKHAREVELNASWCYDWGQKLGDMMEERFGIPYSKTGQPYGLEATKEWLLGVASPLGLEKEALEVIERETREVLPDLAYLKEALEGQDRDHRDHGVSRTHPGPLPGPDGRGVRCPPHCDQHPPIYHQGEDAQHQVPPRDRCQPRDHPDEEGSSALGPSAHRKRRRMSWRRS